MTFYPNPSKIVFVLAFVRVNHVAVVTDLG